MKAIPFSFEGKDYEICVISNGATTYVQAFLDGVPANGYTYQVSFPVTFNFERHLGVSAIGHLIESAKQDITDKAWERLLEAIRQIEEYEKAHPGSTSA